MSGRQAHASGAAPLVQMAGACLLLTQKELCKQVQVAASRTARFRTGHCPVVGHSQGVGDPGLIPAFKITAGGNFMVLENIIIFILK